MPWPHAALVQVAIKFEHTSSKGLTSKGVPYEWEVYTQLGETHGVPRLLHKGFQDGFCIMVRPEPLHHAMHVYRCNRNALSAAKGLAGRLLRHGTP